MTIGPKTTILRPPDFLVLLELQPLYLFCRSANSGLIGCRKLRYNSNMAKALSNSSTSQHVALIYSGLHFFAIFISICTFATYTIENLHENFHDAIQQTSVKQSARIHGNQALICIGGRITLQSDLDSCRMRFLMHQFGFSNGDLLSSRCQTNFNSLVAPTIWLPTYCRRSRRILGSMKLTSKDHWLELFANSWQITFGDFQGCMRFVPFRVKSNFSRFRLEIHVSAVTSFSCLKKLQVRP